MTLKEFSVTEFGRLAETHGGDIGRWPDPVRGPALVLLARSDAARAILDEARAVDALLDQASEPVVSDERAERVLARLSDRLDNLAPPVPYSLMATRGTLRLWPTAGFLAAMGVAGFLVCASGLLPAPASASDFTSVLGGTPYAGTTYLGRL